MALMQRIATATWENARRQQQEQHHGADAGASVSTPATIGEAETAAIDSMRTLYSLGNSIVAATEAAARGENFNLDEMRDVVGVAGGFCRFLGYAEGAERCEEVGRGPFGAGAGDGGRWEGGVF
jgi:hypothetical protein